MWCNVINKIHIISIYVIEYDFEIKQQMKSKNMKRSSVLIFGLQYHPSPQNFFKSATTEGLGAYLLKLIVYEFVYLTYSSVSTNFSKLTSKFRASYAIACFH